MKLGDLRRAIRRSVVDDDDFEKAIAGQVVEYATYSLFFVKRGDDDRSVQRSGSSNEGGTADT
jgi:hypothetical protein